MGESVKESMDVLVAVEAGCDAVIAAAADGKLTLLDAQHFVKTVKPTIEAVRGREKIVAELKNLDEAGVAALVDKVTVVGAKLLEAVDAIAKLVPSV